MSILQISIASTGLWVRVFGYGFSFDLDGQKPMPSERFGYRKVYRFKRLSFEWLGRFK